MRNRTMKNKIKIFISRIYIYKRTYGSKHYKRFLLNTLKLIQRNGALVYAAPSKYQMDLGAVPIYNIFGKATNMYVAYLDYDNSIKYYVAL